MDEEKPITTASDGGEPTGRPEPNYTIERRGRFWAVLDEGVLVCLTVYRRGAVEVKRRLESKGGDMRGSCLRTP